MLPNNWIIPYSILYSRLLNNTLRIQSHVSFFWNILARSWSSPSSLTRPSTSKPSWVLPGGLGRKESTCNAGFNSWVRKIPWRKKWQPTPVFLPGKSHGQRSLAGYSSRGCRSQTQLLSDTEVELVDHMVILFVIFWGNTVLFSKVAAPFYIPTNSVSGFKILHILTCTCHFLFSFFFFNSSPASGWEVIPTT